MSIVTVNTKDYLKEDDLTRVVRYVVRADAEEDVFWDGLGVGTDSAENVIFDMFAVKQMFDKTEGKQLWHPVISFYRYQFINREEDYMHKMNNEEIYCKLIGMEICKLIFEMGYQNIFALHKDTDYLHLHFVVNSINYQTGNHLTNAYTFQGELNRYLYDNYRNLQWEFYPHHHTENV